VELRREDPGPGQRLRFRTNLDEWVVADEAHRLRLRHADGQAIPYIEVRPGLDARIVPSVYYELVDLAEPRGDVLGVLSAWTFFPLGPVPEDGRD
jgi:hypothetical protein